MPLGMYFSRLLLAGLAAAAREHRRPPRRSTKCRFGTNWVAEANMAASIRRSPTAPIAKYGLDVTIVPGGPNANNRILLPVGKIDFFLSANQLEGFDAVAQNVPTVEVAALFQKDPQVLIAHPDQGIEKFEDLKNLTLFVSQEGVATYYQWLKADYGFKDSQVKPYTFNPQPFLANKKSAMQGYVTSEPFAIEKATNFTPKVFLLADQGFSRLFDADRNAARSRRQEARSGAALCRCLDHRLVQLHLSSTTAPANALIKKQNPEMTDDLLAYSVDADEAIRHRRFRRRPDARRRRHDRRAHEGFFRRDGARRRRQSGSRLPQVLHAAIRRQESRPRPAAEAIDAAADAAG